MVYRSCGHICHFKCLQKYQETSSAARYLIDGEISCPTCKNPVNFFLPVLPESEAKIDYKKNHEFILKDFLSPETEEFIEVSKIATKYRNELAEMTNKICANQMETMDSFMIAIRDMGLKLKADFDFDFNESFTKSISYILKFSEVTGIPKFIKFYAKAYSCVYENFRIELLKQRKSTNRNKEFKNFMNKKKKINKIIKKIIRGKKFREFRTGRFSL